MKFRALQFADAGRYGCCARMENGTEQCRNVTLMIHDAIEHANSLQDVAAAHLPEVIERREDLTTGGESYNYELHPGKRLDDADVMLRGGGIKILRMKMTFMMNLRLNDFRKCSLVVSPSCLLF